MSIKQSYERIKDAVAWCCYDGKSLGVYENDFKVLAKAFTEENEEKLYSELPRVEVMIRSCENE